jgi:hypothetical protein
MKNLFKMIIRLLVVPLFYFTGSCSESKDQSDIRPIVKEKLSGYVQKGPYINGTTIQMYELNSSLVQTGKSFTTKIIDNRGSFEINNISLSSQYVEFSASGYYFNENKGDISPSELSLNALSDITDISTVNINILTHLERDRVEYLVETGTDFSQAKVTAQSELLAPFGFGNSNINNSENLNISENDEGNAILLAISVILQGDRSVGDLTELLANISTDLRPDGIIDNNTITLLRNTAVGLNYSSIRTNLEKRYADLDVSAAIPDFEKCIDDFINFTGQKPQVTVKGTAGISLSGAILTGSVHAYGMNTMVTFEYGTTTAYGNTVSAIQNPLSSNLPVNVSARIKDLLPETTYHFRIKAENEKGITYSDDVAFKTSTAGTNNIQYLKFESYYSEDNGQVNVYEIQAFSQGINVALNKTGYMNSPQGGDFSSNGSSAVDGDNFSRWSGNRDDPGPDEVNPQYIVINLEDVYAIDSVRLNIQGFDHWDQTFDFSVSQDNVNWNSIIQGDKITGIFSYSFN